MKNSKLLLQILLVVLIFGPSLGWLSVHWYQAWALERRSWTEFEQWMIAHKYAPEIVDIYRCNYQDPCLKPIMQDYFRLRRGDLSGREECSDGYGKFKAPGPLQAYFIEVVPSGKAVRFQRVDPAALEAFQKYLAARFGRRIELRLQAIVIQHDKALVDSLVDRALYFRTDPALALLMQQFPRPCVVRFDAEEVDGRTLPDVWDTDRCAIFSGENMRLVDNVSAFDHYAHELAHLFGVEHQFVDPLNPPLSPSSHCDTGKEAGRYLGVDDILIKSKSPENRSAGHYVSPLSRFALEPRGGYVDNKDFGEAYSRLYDQGTLKRVHEQACRN